MPKTTRTLHIEITVEQFLNACSPLELREVDMLIQSNHYVRKMIEEGMAGSGNRLGRLAEDMEMQKEQATQ